MSKNLDDVTLPGAKRKCLLFNWYNDENFSIYIQNSFIQKQKIKKNKINLN